VALYLILEAIKAVSAKKTVIIPSFICPLVPLAIKRAGLKVEICDIAGDNFDFDPKQLEELCNRDDILAIVPTHLGGIPLDFDPIRETAKKNGIFIIEDCAQSLGARYKGQLVGTLGDAAFFSLCRGKGLTIYEGGVIVTKDLSLAKLIENKIKERLKNNFFQETLKIFELFGYWIFYRPRAFWFVYRLPQLFWNLRGKKLKADLEEYDIDFPVHQVSVFRKAVGHGGFYHLEGQIKQQREKAEYYMERLSGVKGLKVVKESALAQASYPYITVIFDQPQMKQRALAYFAKTNLGLSQIYTLAISDYPYLKGIVPQRYCPAGRYLAERAITLSTSIFLDHKTISRIVDKIKQI